MPPRPAPREPVHLGRLYLILMCIYCGFIIYGSLVPFRFRYIPLEQAVGRFRQIPHFYLGIQSRSDLAANFLLFIPLTFLAMGALTRENRRRGRALIAVAVAAGAILLNGAIEFTQIYFPDRTASKHDILAQVAGGITGILLWSCCGGRITRWARSLWEERARNRIAVTILSGYVVFLILYQLFPFDLTLSPVEVYHKLKASRITLLPFCDRAGLDAYNVLSKAAIMIPVGYLLVLVRRWERWRSIFVVTAQVGLLAALIEMAQLFVFSRYSSSTDVVFGVVGGFLGVVAAAMFGPLARYPVIETSFWARHGKWIRLAAAVVWLGGLVWEKWHPFDFVRPQGGLAAGAREILAVPLARQYFLSEFLALSQVVREFTTFFILGILLMGVLAPAGRAGKIGCAVLAAGLAVALEFGQGFLPSRTADLTATAIGCMGGVMGIWLFRGFVNVFVKTDHGTINRQHTGE